MILPRALDQLSIEQTKELIRIHTIDPHKRELPGRVFSHDLKSALEVVRSHVDDVLGKNMWRLYGGNFFETFFGYRVHADTGHYTPNDIWQTIVFPLEYELTESAELEKNQLLIFNQEWTGRPAFFLKGGDPNPAMAGNTSYDFVYDYKEVKNLIADQIDEETIHLCRHLDRTNLQGLSVDKSFLWEPRTPITFPRTRLHASSAFHTFGIKRKLGLSLFFAPINS